MQEARTILNNTLAQIEENRVKNNIEPYRYFGIFEDVVDGIIGLNLVGGFMGAFIILGFILGEVLEPSVYLLYIPIAVFTGLLAGMSIYDGSPKNKFASFLAKKINTKKRRKEFQAIQQEIKNMETLQEVFDAYVKLKNQELEDRGVWKILNTNNPTHHHYLDNNGNYKTREIPQKQIEKEQNENKQALKRMLNEISNNSTNNE